MSIKDQAKIKNWFAYRNHKMNHIINHEEVASSFVKPLPSINSDIYFNISKQMYAYNIMMFFKTLVQSMFIQQSNFQSFTLLAQSKSNFAVKREI